MISKDPKGRAKSIAALAPYRFKSGVSGNPNGRPKRFRITDDLREILDSPVPEKIAKKHGLPPGTTFSKVVAMRLVHTALKGSVNATREIADRDEGKPKQRIELVGEGGTEIRFHVIYDKPTKGSG